MKLAIHQLLDSEPDNAALDAFLEGREVPIVEGTSVTFLYRGRADAVELRHFIYGLPSSQPFHRIPGTDGWYCTQSLPEASRVEYKIDVISGGDHHWIRDPLNPHLAYDPFGANSVCHGHGYERPDWTLHDPDARQGELKEIRVYSEVYRRRRHVQVYLPARFRKRRRYPLMIVHDGPDFLRYAGLQTVLDNLIYRLEIPPMIVALTRSRNRLEEYGADPDHARFIAEDLLPVLEERFPVQREPGGRCLMGASFGAVASFTTARYFPHLFGRLLLLSGSFAFSDIGPHERGPAFDPVVEMVNAYRSDPIPLAEKVFLACGMYESLIYENRSFLPLLQKTGMEIRYAEARDGHNWENWRDRLREGLSWLFPGPLWMVYE
jgi:enterochelin esterase family protein